MFGDLDWHLNAARVELLVINDNRSGRFGRFVRTVRCHTNRTHDSDKGQGHRGRWYIVAAYSLFKLLLSSLYRWCKLEGSVLFQRQKQLDTTVKTTIRAVIKWRCFLTRTSPSTLNVLEEEYVRRWTVPLVWIGNSYSWNVCRACRLYVTSTSAVRSLSTSLYGATKITLHLHCCSFNLHSCKFQTKLFRLCNYMETL